MAADMLRAALAYRGLGWAVVPVHTPSCDGCSCRADECPSPGKHPRVRWHEYDRTAPPLGSLKRWWTDWPDTNIGVLTGCVSNAVVIDVDPRNGGEESLTLMEARFGACSGFAETLTGGSGRHLWFTGWEGRRLASRVLAPGLELKAEGSMVVVPPSLHASGSRYEWAPGREPWAAEAKPLPDWLAVEDGGPRPAEEAAPVRTGDERVQFADMWVEVGIELAPGDRYYSCPFHADEHPSLHIDAEGCRWYCFGCRQGGGPGTLARLLGHPLPARPPGRKTGQVGRRRAVSIRGPADVSVVGESHHQDELLTLVGGRRPYGGVDVRTVAELLPDVANVHDRQAVEVLIDDQPVGYLRHDEAVAYRTAIEDAIDMHGFATCWARIRGGWDRGHGEVGMLGVTLELPSPEGASS